VFGQELWRAGQELGGQLMMDFKWLQQDPPAGISNAPHDNNIMPSTKAGRHWWSQSIMPGPKLTHIWS
jgi:hypothetical protein